MKVEGRREAAYWIAPPGSGWSFSAPAGGFDWEVSVVPAAARAVLVRLNDRATHYELRVGRSPAGAGLQTTPHHIAERSPSPEDGARLSAFRADLGRGLINAKP